MYGTFVGTCEMAEPGRVDMPSCIDAIKKQARGKKERGCCCAASSSGIGNGALFGVK